MQFKQLLIINKKRWLLLGISSLTIIGIILLTYIFSAKDIASIKNDFKGLNANEITQIKIEKTVNDKIGGTTTNIIVDDKETIEKIINTINSTNFKINFNQYNGGTVYEVSISNKKSEIINIVFNQGFISGTKYRSQGDELWKLFNLLSE